ncbi:uncharacterized protein N7477_005922 [Penicillium maclennaniae]|uniref:uncharacterized protein n=1 Tax=Penicillium maclennaniae TaxID=1343394 RepID=UPI0025416BB4|nr:uncharacterized protein N7477_005922 [Penicillium maclennaniae]KAJ5670559.1 hypothetical protein N7477_005922 [Penicillium maclennaniae]
MTEISGLYRIGVDVGGTNTDAAIIDIAATDSESRDVAIGTTHFVNAVVEADARRLSKVAVVRLCGPFTKQVPPFSDFPPELKDIMAGPVIYLDGGLEIDGREITPLCPIQVQKAVESIQEAGINLVAVVGVFSPLDHQGLHEETCRRLMLEQDPTLSVVCSHMVGGVGLLERENATILNASILNLARHAATAAELPIKTFASGPTNSMTGAAFLAFLDRGAKGTASETQVLVMDVGGTTSDICALLPSGFPRQAPNFVEVGGVRTAFSMPEVLSVGLGGGSRVIQDTGSDRVHVGPESVGHYLTSEALVFGGNVMTTTDIVVASGKAEIGDIKRAQAIPESVVTKTRLRIKRILEQAVESMKVSDAPVTLLLVGGGSIVRMDDLQGVAECIIPPHHDSANAVGAAIAKVVGEIDSIEVLEGRDENTVLEEAKTKAIENAVARGADRADIKIVAIDKIPLQYVTNKATRLVIKAVGRLALQSPGTTQMNGAHTNDMSTCAVIEESEPEARRNYHQKPETRNFQSLVKYSAFLDIDAYAPDVRNGIWYISPVDLEFIATGTGVLGTGGGGPSYLQYLQCLESLRQPNAKGKMRVVDPRSLNDSDVIVFGSWYGAPSVSGERIPAGREIMTAIDQAVKMSGYTHFEGVMADKIGGGNGMSTFPTSVYYDIPVVDGDLMGRAYPTMEHGEFAFLDDTKLSLSDGFCVKGTAYVYGEPITPCALADGKGNTSVILKAESNRRVETMLRSQCVDLGLNIAVACTPLPGKSIKRYAVPKTVSQSWYIGRAVHKARCSKTNIIDAIFETSPGRLLYTGKIVDVKRHVSRGYTMGQCTIAPLTSEEKDPKSSRSESPSSDETRYLIIPFQNEFLYAAYADVLNPDDTSRHEVICTVPDLISVLGQDGEAIGSQELRYGLRVNIIGMAAHPLWTGDKRGLKVGGPEGFGLDMEWKSLGPYQEPRSVVQEFNVAS